MKPKGGRSTLPAGAAANGASAAATSGGSQTFAMAGTSGLANDPNRPGMVAPALAAGTGGEVGCLEAVVQFVIDGSGSMCEVFGNQTRWTALRSALLAPMTGFIPRFEAEAQFGLMIYDGSIDLNLALTATNASPNPACAGVASLGGAFAPPGAMGDCPRLVQVPPRFGNTAAINMAFPMAQLGGSTPTDKAMDAAVTQMVQSAMGKNPKTNPHFIILATDGQPNDICTAGTGGDGSLQKAGVLAAVDRAAAAGIATFVISLAGADALLQQHLDEVAKHGNPLDPMAHTYSPATPEDLVTTLRGVLSTALGCPI